MCVYVRVCVLFLSYSLLPERLWLLQLAPRSEHARLFATPTQMYVALASAFVCVYVSVASLCVLSEGICLPSLHKPCPPSARLSLRFSAAASLITAATMSPVSTEETLLVTARYVLRDGQEDSADEILECERLPCERDFLFRGHWCIA